MCKCGVYACKASFASTILLKIVLGIGAAVEAIIFFIEKPGPAPLSESLMRKTLPFSTRTQPGRVRRSGSANCKPGDGSRKEQRLKFSRVIPKLVKKPLTERKQSDIISLAPDRKLKSAPDAET